VDNNGSVNCDDHSVLIPSLDTIVGSVVGEVVYEVSIDENLDGSISFNELREFLLDLQPADASLDGVVMANDFSAWIAAFNVGDLAADANRDGAVTPTDFGAWSGAFNQPCP
jgi:hypothetical protein